MGINNINQHKKVIIKLTQINDDIIKVIISPIKGKEEIFINDENKENRTWESRQKYETRLYQTLS